MSEVSYAPLSAACVRALTDKMYDKRKAAALEIEKLTRECVAIPNHVQIQKLVKVLGTDFALSQNSNMRKGGLIGLAAMAIALGKETSIYSEDLIRPILTCMSDTDSRVRYYACESLYNVTKVTRSNIMSVFNEIFLSMTIVITDLDSSVRTAAELLDKLLKDIVTESDNFTLDTFVPVLKDKMYSKDAFARAFTLGWIQAMYNADPNSKFVDHLPEILDPLFLILNDNSQDICTKCEEVFGNFLTDIKSASPPEHIAFNRMINVLVTHAQSANIRLQIMAVQWILDFIRLSGNQMLPFTSGILVAILPNLAFDDERRRHLAEDDYRRVRDLSGQVNMDLMKLIRSSQRLRKSTPPDALSDGSLSTYEIDLKSVLEVLTKQLHRGRVDTKLAVLRWIYHLYTIARDKMIDHVEDLFPVLLKTMSDPSDEVVILNLQVLAELCKSEKGETNPHFKLFHLSLLRLFSADRKLLDTKGSFIIRQLCVLMNSEDIYCCLSELLRDEPKLKFARLMVETLNTILLTSSELFSLRSRLKELNSKGSSSMFVCLYRTWCHSQVATVALCLLSGCYSHAKKLVQLISDQEVTMEMLVELDRLIQLIESPIFTSLRMELLDNEMSRDLVETLSGLLMIMPQTAAFRLLRDRLGCLPTVQRLHVSSEPKKATHLAINFGELIDHFQTVQHLHGKMIRAQRSEDIISKSAKIIDFGEDDVSEQAED